jgi:hypothetical protein
MARDGYDAVQLGFGDRSRTKSSRSVRGHVTVLGGRRQQSRSLAGVAAWWPRRSVNLSDSSASFAVKMQVTVWKSARLLGPALIR